ncbi:RNA polymerase sigma (SigW) subunit [Salsuginibacillus halophilus]|uniref:RNA polymerase sigma factor n=1 Tax=Salsuginibacillus halophilus TaxID=517424 RepID=A0A2P8H3Q8_9BACI|nr:RNA polymerase sigma factor SigW [Salsuginibacillus halophilus]PSL40830.1 RNA polymerase sigma (SigW) subunit [Salsuginibacillus halophilus]
MEDDIHVSIEEVRQGNDQAYRAIVDTYTAPIYSHVCRMTHNSHEAQEIAQETFLRAYINLNRYDVNRKFSTWLYRIATNLTIDRIRKRKPDLYLDAELPESSGMNGYNAVAAPVVCPEDKVVQQEWQEQVRHAVMALPPKYRKVILLKYMEDCSTEEISCRLQLPENTVKTHVHRGREALRKQFIKVESL